MAEYIPPSLDWVREQVEKYEGSDGTEGYDVAGYRPAVHHRHPTRETKAAG